MDIRDKKLSEEDIKSRYITPALEARGWKKEQMRMEFSYTAGTIVVQGSFKHRKAGKRCDYVLYSDSDLHYPIAVIESKDYKHTHYDGIQQAIDYATDLDIPFAYSTNGEKYMEHDMITGDRRTIEPEDFPTLLELRERVKTEKKYTDDMSLLIDHPYYTSSDSYPPRYYQRIAINKTIEAIARGQKKIMLVMATGTGKTYTAFQIIHRLHASGLMKRILYVADRNILIDQSMRQDFKPFKKFMTKVQGKTPEQGYELYMSLYGQWTKNFEDMMVGEKQPYEYYAKDFFDLIVVDECHRSSINEDKQWHQILEYFDSATKIGLTATPKCVEGANNVEYYGEPVYKYSLEQGIKDGFLAPYRITKSFLSVDLDGYIPEEDEKDLFDNHIEDYIFTRNEFGRKINIKRRQLVVAKRITEMMKIVGRMTKTIVFCPDQEEAAIMRDLLVANNQDLVKKNPNYVVRITSDDRVGKKLLDDFIDPYAEYPVIATTSELLTTGVDCKTCGLIVIDKEVNNDIIFRQMIGRGTRIFEEANKLSFEILDFRDATRLFSQSFDGDAEKMVYKDRKNRQQYDMSDEAEESSIAKEDEKPKYHVEGRNVTIVHEHVMYLDADGKTLLTESLTDFTRKAIKKHYPTLDAFRGAWKNADKKQAILDVLAEADVLIDAVKEENPALKDCDEFDIICHVAFDQKPLTRKERMNNVKKRNYFAKYEGQAKEILEALLDKYGEVGISNIEDKDILNLNPFTKYGKKVRIVKGIFKGQFASAVAELENELYVMEA